MIQLTSQARNPMDPIISSAKAAFARIGLSASGPLPRTNPEKVLADVAILEKQLTFLKAAARAEIASRKRAVRDAAKLKAAYAEQDAANAAELDRRRAEQARRESMSGNMAADGLVHMMKMGVGA